MDEFSKKANLDKLDRQIEEFKSKKHKNSPKRLKVQNDGWRMVIELVVGLLIGLGIGLVLDIFFNTKPLFLIIFVLLGFIAGIKTMMNTAKTIKKEALEGDSL